MNMPSFEARSAPRCVDDRPALLVTIDTEGDNIWANKTPAVTTTNAHFLPRFQSLCESYGLKPTYLTNYEMATSKAFREFGLDVLRRNVGEIGMHLHAWNTPPLSPLTDNDYFHQPYLTEYATNVMREKIRFMTQLLERTFEVKIVSHRAGRWGFNGTYARLLAECGYCVDCSVTPHISWRLTRGDPTGKGGPDYSRFPDNSYFVDLDDISEPARDSLLLEVPVTILPGRISLSHRLVPFLERIPMTMQIWNHVFPTHWLRPTGKNIAHLLSIAANALERKSEYLEFMLHSSELMPGGSPYFRTTSDIERLYDDLKLLFEFIHSRIRGSTLKEYYYWKLDKKTRVTAHDLQSQRLGKSRTLQA
jgi:hypothetical protein